MNQGNTLLKRSKTHCGEGAIFLGNSSQFNSGLEQPIGFARLSSSLLWLPVRLARRLNGLLRQLKLGLKRTRRVYALGQHSNLTLKSLLSRYLNSSAMMPLKMLSQFIKTRVLNTFSLRLRAKLNYLA